MIPISREMYTSALNVATLAAGICGSALTIVLIREVRRIAVRQETAAFAEGVVEGAKLQRTRRLRSVDSG